MTGTKPDMGSEHRTFKLWHRSACAKVVRLRAGRDTPAAGFIGMSGTDSTHPPRRKHDLR